MLIRKVKKKPTPAPYEIPAEPAHALPTLRMDTPLLFSVAVTGIIILGGSLVSWQLNGAPAVHMMLILGILVGFGFRQHVTITEGGVFISQGLRKTEMSYENLSLYVEPISGLSCLLATLRPRGYCLCARSTTGRIKRVSLLLSLTDGQLAQALIEGHMQEKRDKEEEQWREIQEIQKQHALSNAEQIDILPHEENDHRSQL